MPKTTLKRMKNTAKKCQNSYQGLKVMQKKDGMVPKYDQNSKMSRNVTISRTVTLSRTVTICRTVTISRTVTVFEAKT